VLERGRDERRQFRVVVDVQYADRVSGVTLIVECFGYVSTRT